MDISKATPGEEIPGFYELPRALYPAGGPRHLGTEAVNPDGLAATYLVMADGKPLARAARYRADRLDWEGRRVALVGYYECVERQDVAEALLAAVEEDARADGADYLVGPMNGSTWDDYRFSTSHDFPNFLLEPYHHLYYIQQFQDAGFGVISRYTSNIDTELACDWPQVFDKEREFADNGVRIRPIDTARLADELEALHPFIDETFSGNFLYSPIPKSRFVEKYRAAAPIIDTDFVLIAEDADRRPVGFVFSYPDAYNRRGGSLIIKTLARASGKRFAGLGHVLANRVIRVARQRGYRSVVHAFIIERGDATLVSGNFAGRPYKEYVLLGKPL